jgi:hypothetical protein
VSEPAPFDALALAVENVLSVLLVEIRRLPQGEDLDTKDRSFVVPITNPRVEIQPVDLLPRLIVQAHPASAGIMDPFRLLRGHYLSAIRAE